MIIKNEKSSFKVLFWHRHTSINVAIHKETCWIIVDDVATVSILEEYANKLRKIISWLSNTRNIALNNGVYIQMSSTHQISNLSKDIR